MAQHPSVEGGGNDYYPTAQVFNGFLATFSCIFLCTITQSELVIKKTYKDLMIGVKILRKKIKKMITAKSLVVTEICIIYLPIS